MPALPINPYSGSPGRASLRIFFTLTNWSILIPVFNDWDSLEKLLGEIDETVKDIKNIFIDSVNNLNKVADHSRNTIRLNKCAI